MKHTRLPKILVLMLALTGFFINQAKATHVAGADLTYRDLGNNDYEITLTYYRDCSGSMPIQAESLTVASTNCGVNFNVNLPVANNTGNEITFPCNSSASTCSGGSSFGVQKWSYVGIVHLPIACSDYVFSWNRCCRNCAITTTIHGNCNNDPQSNIYVESTLNNLNVSGNNSPTFSNDPVATMCVGQNFIFNHGVFDADGDSLVYSVVGSEIAPGTNVSYQPGYSAANPINSIPALSINSATGDLSMTPQQIEIGVMAVKVDEYRAGVHIGSVRRDMQFIVQVCNNTLPTASGINGTADFDTTICPGTQLCFYIFTADADAQQSLQLTATNTIPGGVFNNSGGSHPTGSFCWTPTAADARSTPWTFTVTVRDDACPTNAIQTYSFSITVPEIALSTIADDGNGTIDLTVGGNSGPYTYNWSTGATTEDISGLTPGIYTATVCDINGCCNTIQDTIATPVNCTFNVHTTKHNASCTCDGWANLAPSGGTAPYTYLWSNGVTTAMNSNLCAGTYSFTVTDANGCSYTCHSVITGPVSLNVTASGSGTCIGACHGAASANVTGGVAPYTYLWNNGDVTAALTDLCCGTYTVTVTDANGCTGTCHYTVTKFQALGLSAVVTNATDATSCDGKVVATASNGTPGYDFLWSTGSSASGVSVDSITTLCGGNYSVTITDANGCTRKLTKAVGPLKVSQTSEESIAHNSSARFATDDENSPFNATAIPNPFHTEFSIETGNDEAATVYIYSVTGTLVKAYKNIYSGQRIGSELSSGMYLVQIMQNGNIVYQRLAKQE